MYSCARRTIFPCRTDMLLPWLGFIEQQQFVSLDWIVDGFCALGYYSPLILCLSYSYIHALTAPLCLTFVS